MNNSLVKRIQRTWRAKRVFTNDQHGYKLSKSKMISSIVHVETNVDLFKAGYPNVPKRFTEILEYSQKSPIARYTGGRWVTRYSGKNPTRIVAKHGTQTVHMTKHAIDVLGSGNYERAFLDIVRNGWAPKDLLRKKPEYKKIDGMFYVNKPFLLNELSETLRGLPMEKTVRYTPELFPAVILKLKNPAWTYQFFKNGTVIFSGIKDPADIEKPRELFKKFFTEYIPVIFAINIAAKGIVTKPIPENKKQKLAKLAQRYPIAGTWNALKNTPEGFYIRPGTNGKPRFYPHRILERRPELKGYLNMGPMNMRGVAPKVVKAFEKAGRPIPQSTKNVFNRLGIQLEAPKKTVTTGKERRAPGWNAVDPNGKMYVRPGPGQQPYWYKVPKGKKAAQRTVIDSYLKAGRNIPQTVRNIFNIKNLPIGAVPTHVITIGLNGHLRINGRQWTRLTKGQLLEVARNLNLPEVNTKMTPRMVAEYIMGKVKPARPNKAFNVQVGTSKYTFLPFGRLQRNVGTKRTERQWYTLPVKNRNAIAKAYLPATNHAEWNTRKNYTMLTNKKEYNRLIKQHLNASNNNNNN